MSYTQPGSNSSGPFAEYSEKNSISMVLQKQNVIIGKKELDITKDIILILNEKIKKIDIN